MTIFNVSYDLVDRRNYQRLHDGIKRTCPNWAKVLESTWLVEYAGSSLDLTKALVKFMDGDDKIFVTQVVSGSSAWRGIDGEVVNWINRQRAA